MRRLLRVSCLLLWACAADAGRDVDAPRDVPSVDAVGEAAEPGDAAIVDATGDPGESQDVPRVDAGRDDLADAAEDAGDEAADVPVVRRFSFALFTDIHIGEGYRDFGTAGFDDSGGEPYALVDRIVAAVDKVDAARDAYDIRFVFVLGDLTDSGEASEFVLARTVLETLDVPCFPLIGNHDIWPYYRLAEGDPAFVEADGPTGDQVFGEVFGEHFAALGDAFPGLVKAPTCSPNPELDITSCFQNYAFDYEGYHFVALDSNTRVHAPPGYPGIGPEAAIHDFEGGTWPFFVADLEAHADAPDGSVFVLLHHPALGVDTLAFPTADFAKMSDLIVDQGHGRRIAGFFAGHWHMDLVEDVKLGGVPVVLTPAAKDASAVRVVQVYSDGTVDFSVLL